MTKRIQAAQIFFWHCVTLGQQSYWRLNNFCNGLLGTVYELLCDFNQDFGSRAALISAVQINRMSYTLRRLCAACWRLCLICIKLFFFFFFFVGLVWGEHDHPTTEPSCEGSRSKSHCRRYCRYVVSTICNNLFTLCRWCGVSTALRMEDAKVNS